MQCFYRQLQKEVDLTDLSRYDLCRGIIVSCKYPGNGNILFIHYQYYAGTQGRHCIPSEHHLGRVLSFPWRWGIRVLVMAIPCYWHTFPQNFIHWGMLPTYIWKYFFISTHCIYRQFVTHLNAYLDVLSALPPICSICSLRQVHFYYHVL